MFADAHISSFGYLCFSLSEVEKKKKNVKRSINQTFFTDPTFFHYC